MFEELWKDFLIEDIVTLIDNYVPDSLHVEEHGLVEGGGLRLFELHVKRINLLIHFILDLLKIYYGILLDGIQKLVNLVICFFLHCEGMVKNSHVTLLELLWKSLECLVRDVVVDLPL